MLTHPERTSPRPRRRATKSRSATPATPAGRFDRAFWLSRCQGYRVDAAGGRLGFVEEVRPADVPNELILVIRAGKLGRRLLLVSTKDVAFVVPRAERIWLHQPVVVGSEAR